MSCLSFGASSGEMTVYTRATNAVLKSQLDFNWIFYTRTFCSSFHSPLSSSRVQLHNPQRPVHTRSVATLCTKNSRIPLTHRCHVGRRRPYQCLSQPHVSPFLLPSCSFAPLDYLCFPVRARHHIYKETPYHGRPWRSALSQFRRERSKKWSFLLTLFPPLCPALTLRAQTQMKIRLKGAKTGHSLLKKKSDALTMRFRDVLRQIIKVRTKKRRGRRRKERKKWRTSPSPFLTRLARLMSLMMQ